MFGWMKHGRNNHNDWFSRTSRGHGVSTRGNQGEADLLDRRGSKSSFIKALNISDDEYESQNEYEDGKFD